MASLSPRPVSRLVYSFAVVLSELASGQMPFSDRVEFIQREESFLSDEQLRDLAFLGQMRKEGYLVENGKAIKEVFNV
jgi:hypothetical protein